MRPLVAAKYFGADQHGDATTVTDGGRDVPRTNFAKRFHAHTQFISRHMDGLGVNMLFRSSPMARVPSRHGARELCCKINNATAKDCNAEA